MIMYIIRPCCLKMWTCRSLYSKHRLDIISFVIGWNNVHMCTSVVCFTWQHTRRNYDLFSYVLALSYDLLLLAQMMRRLCLNEICYMIKDATDADKMWTSVRLFDVFTRQIIFTYKGTLFKFRFLIWQANF